jgi:prevent-host-death family protein
MQISVSELKINVGKYIDMAETQDIFITKNGKQVAKIVSTKIDKVAAMKSIFGAIHADTDLDKAKAKRLL